MKRYGSANGDHDPRPALQPTWHDEKKARARPNDYATYAGSRQRAAQIMGALEEYST